MEFSEALQIANQAVFACTNKHLTDLQINVFLGAWQGKNYEQIAMELKYTHKYISQQVGPSLWELLSHALGEPVSKTNFRAALERRRNTLPMPKQETLHPTKLAHARVLIGDRSQNPNFNMAEQLSIELKAAGIEISTAFELNRLEATWPQLIQEELEQCDCFVLLLSSESAAVSEIVLEEVRQASFLRNSRPNSKPAILLIHVGSPMILPLNHALHSYLQGIEQREWRSSNDTPTLVSEVLRLLAADQSSAVRAASESLNSVSVALGRGEQDSCELVSSTQKLSRLNDSRNWVLTYVGENQLKKLGDLVDDLTDPRERRIQSGYSYWGVGPVQMWNQACNDHTYHMRDNLLRFPEIARKLAHLVDKERYNFVSLGVGDGSKDRSIISDFFNRNGSSQTRDDFVYIPVDMSLDMLRVAIENIQSTNQLPLDRRIAIQRDIEIRDGMVEIAWIAKQLGAQRPILYGFIGNTIANFENPQHVMSNIVGVMETDDLLLFEAQIVDETALSAELLERTTERIRREYLSDSFRRFAESALRQNTDLTIDPTENNCYVVHVSKQDWEHGPVLQIDCFFENNSERPVYMTLVNGQSVRLDLKERIRLYRSRKFPQRTLQNFVKANSLDILGQSEYLSDKRTGFMVMMLRRLNFGETS